MLAFPFAGNFRGVFDGEVISILPNGKRKCKYDDSEIKLHTVAELRKYYTTTHVHSNEEQDNADTESREDAEVLDITDVDNDSEIAEEEITEQRPKLSGKYFKELVELSLAELESRPTAKEAFIKSIAHPINIVQDRFRGLQLDGRNVAVKQHPTDKDVKALETALRTFDPDYDPAIRNMARLKKMSMLHELLNDKRHVQCTEYTFEIRICGENDCNICMRFGRSIRTPNVGKLRKKVLQYLTMPITNPDDEEHFLSAEDAEKVVVAKKMSIEDQMKFLPGI
jgi:hypothetical protein